MAIRVGVTNTSCPSNAHFYAVEIDWASDSCTVALMDCRRFVKETFDIKRQPIESITDNYVDLSVSDDGLHVGNWYRDRNYSWADVIKFGTGKILWYETCVINCHRTVIGNMADGTCTEEADYLVSKLFSAETAVRLLSADKAQPSTQTAADSDQERFTVKVDADCQSIFTKLCHYQKPTVLMVDRPYSQTEHEEEGDYYNYYGEDNSTISRNFLHWDIGSMTKYLDKVKEAQPALHTVKVAVFDDAIPSLTDYFDNYSRVITPDNTLTITSSIVMVNETTAQFVLQVSKAN